MPCAPAASPHGPVISTRIPLRSCGGICCCGRRCAIGERHRAGRGDDPVSTPQTLPGRSSIRSSPGSPRPPPGTTRAAPSSSPTWAPGSWTRRRYGRARSSWMWAAGKVRSPSPPPAGPGTIGRVYAIDLARPMLDAAAAQARACGLGTITVQRGDAEDPPFPAGRFDVILAGNVIQLLPRPAHAVRRWLCLLKPGGTLGFSWGLAQDPRWEPVMAAVDAHVPAGMSGFEAFLRRPPFDGTDPVEQMLTGTGYQAVETLTHHRHRLRQPGAVVGRRAGPRPRGRFPGGTSRPPGWTPPARPPSPSWTTCAGPAARSPAPSPSPAPPPASPPVQRN